MCGLLLADSGRYVCAQEVDLHTKRTGHRDFADKTTEVANSINLEASLNPASSSEAMDVDTLAYESEKPKDWVI